MTSSLLILTQHKQIKKKTNSVAHPTIYSDLVSQSDTTSLLVPKHHHLIEKLFFLVSDPVNNSPTYCHPCSTHLHASIPSHSPQLEKQCQGDSQGYESSRKSKRWKKRQQARINPDFPQQQSPFSHCCLLF